jgi:hypothetical protein
MVSEFELRRLEKITDNKEMRPLDLLKLVIAQIEAGETPADGLFILAIDRHDNGNLRTVNRYRCGLNRQDEVAFLADSQLRALEHWREPLES